MTQPSLFDLPDLPDLLDVDSCQEKWKVEPGEVFVLEGQSRHVLVCDSSLDGKVVERVLDLVAIHLGDFAARRRLMIADPPYGFGHRSSSTERLGQGGHRLRSRRKDNELDGGDVFDPSWMPLWRDVFDPHAVYLFSKWTVTARWKLAMELNDWAPKARIIWDKMHFGMGDASSYGDKTEDVLCWYEQGCSPKWDKREGNIWSEARGVCLEGGMVGHPTPKPFGVYRRPVQHMTEIGDLVIDPFGGSGPAIIVAPAPRSTPGRRRSAVSPAASSRCATTRTRSAPSLWSRA